MNGWRQSTLVALAITVVVGLSGCAADPEAAPSTESSSPSPTVTTDAPAPSPEPSVSEGADVEPMDPPEIRTGDFSSVEGVWTAPSGDELTITPDRIQWSTGRGTYGSINGRRLTLQTGQHHLATDDEPADLASQAAALWFSWDAGGFSRGSMLAFIPAGVEADSLLGSPFEADSSQDRIVILTEVAAGRLVPTDLTGMVAMREGAAQPSAPASRSSPSASRSSAPASQPSTPSSGRPGGNTPAPPVEGAYPGAGRGIPGNATEVDTVLHGYGDTAILVTPSGNIGCDIYLSDASGPPTMQCRVKSWDTAPPRPPSGTGDGYPTVNFGDGSRQPVFGGTRNDPMCFMEGACAADNGPLAPQVVQYGEVVHAGGFVCASEQNGLTCWNAGTGHGAMVSRSTFAPF